MKDAPYASAMCIAFLLTHAVGPWTLIVILLLALIENLLAEQARRSHVTWS